MNEPKEIHPYQQTTLRISGDPLCFLRCAHHHSALEGQIKKTATKMQLEQKNGSSAEHGTGSLIMMALESAGRLVALLCATIPKQEKQIILNLFCMFRQAAAGKKRAQGLGFLQGVFRIVGEARYLKSHKGGIGQNVMPSKTSKFDSDQTLLTHESCSCSEQYESDLRKRTSLHIANPAEVRCGDQQIVDQLS